VVGIDRRALLRSLAEQREELARSIVLTPVDSLPFILADREHTGFLHGLYLTDKLRDPEAKREAKILFGGREAAAQDIVEIHRVLAATLKAADGSLRLLAGLHAHTAVFMSIGRIGQRVLLLPEEAGGHFSTHAILERLGLHTLDIPIDYERLCVDRTETLRLVKRWEPDFVFIDRSEGLRYEDFSFLGALEGPTKVFDASQYLAPIIAGAYANPLDWGFQLMLFSLHKSFPGPQKAGVVTRERDEIWERLVKGLGTLVSSSHAENTYLVGLTLLREHWLRAYSSRLLASAIALERELLDRGLPVVDRSRQGEPDWPQTHHIWIRPEDDELAFRQYEHLTASRILTNYRQLPYSLGYGLRLGTTYSAVAGIGPGHAAELADIISASFAGDPAPALRDRVEKLAQMAAADAILPSRYWFTKG
jgi:glycine hydroxymethyltransferase